MASRTLQVVITGDASGAKGAFKDAEGGADSFGSKMSDLGGKLMGFGAKMSVGVTLPLALLGKAAFNAASDMNESMSKVDAIFEGNAGKIRRWADGAAEDFGQSSRSALDAAGSFGNMFLQLGIGIEPATKMSKKMTELASDFASFHNADITEVIQAQSAAFRGEYDALQRFVPTINAAAVETKALAMTGKDNADSLTQQEKAAATYALMMEGAGKALGDFDRTAGGAANKQRQLTAKFEDAKAKIGEALIPIFQQLAGVLSTLADKFSSLSPGMQNLVVIGALAAAAIGPLATALGGIVTIVGLLASPIIAVGVAIGALIGFAVLLYLKWDEVWNAVAKHPALLLILAPLGAILLPIIALVGAIKLVQEHWGTIWPIVQGIVEGVWSVLQPVLEAGVSVINAVAGAVVWVWEKCVEAWPVIQGLVEGAWKVMQPLLDAGLGVINAIAGAVVWLWERSVEAWPIIQGAVETAWNAMRPWLDALLGAIGGIVDAVRWIADNAAAAWDGFKSGVSTMWGAVQGPLNALKSVLDGIASAARAVKSALDAIPNVSGPGGPSLGTQLERAGYGGQRAGGGPVSAGGMYLVGERGPELFMSGSSGSIIPNHALGGNNYSINVQVAPGGSPAETGRAIVEAIKSYEDRSGATWRAA